MRKIYCITGTIDAAIDVKSVNNCGADKSSEVLRDHVHGDVEPAQLVEASHGQGDGRVQVAAGDASAHQDANHQRQAVAQGHRQEILLSCCENIN